MRGEGKASYLLRNRAPSGNSFDKRGPFWGEKGKAIIVVQDVPAYSPEWISGGLHLSTSKEKGEEGGRWVLIKT